MGFGTFGLDLSEINNRVDRAETSMAVMVEALHTVIALLERQNELLAVLTDKD